MSELSFFNMKHGDCFLLSDDQNGFLVDCGTRGKKSPLSTQFALFSKLIPLCHLDIAISHFDQDHINQIKDLPSWVIFENVYLSNLINPYDISVLFSMLTLYKKSNSVYQFAYYYLTIIPTISSHLRPNSTIHYLSNPSVIINPICSFSVLWPQKSVSTSISLVGDSRAQSFTTKYMALFAKYLDKDGEIIVREELVDSELSQSIMALVSEYVAEIPPVSEEAVSDTLSALTTEEKNKSSLVLLDGGRSLFLGDVDRNNFQKYIWRFVPDHVEFLKTPHHGSISHYSLYLPSATFALIPESADFKKIDWAGYSSPKFLLRAVGSPRKTLPSFLAPTVVVDSVCSFFY